MNRPVAFGLGIDSRVDSKSRTGEHLHLKSHVHSKKLEVTYVRCGTFRLTSSREINNYVPTINFIIRCLHVGRYVSPKVYVTITSLEIMWSADVHQIFFRCGGGTAGRNLAGLVQKNRSEGTFICFGVP